MNETYPVDFDIEYPDRSLNRLTTFFRIIMLIPIAIVLASIGGGFHAVNGHEGRGVAAAAGGLLILGPLLMIVFRHKYPRWWFDWNQELLRFSTRVWLYTALLDDRYPSTDEKQSLTLNLRYPDAPRELHRLLPIVKWLLAIPHYIVLIILDIGVFFVTIFAWFAILFTGRYPRGVFGFVVGVQRWHTRVLAYAFLLTTDRYPPFSLE